MDITFLGYALLVSLLINLTMFVVAFRLQSDKLTDISYAATFATIAVWAFATSDRNASHLVLLAMLLLWSLRLGGFLLYRVIKTGKDARFDGMRESFVKFGKFWVAQAVSVWVIMIPAVFAFGESGALNTVSFIGLFVWFIGWVCESIADWQKFTFSSDPRNKGKWIESGIWKYSRHPNYFGEIMVWLGVYIFAFSSITTLQALVGLVSPLFITSLLLFVSGIPILEKSADKRWGDKEAYRAYKRSTSILIPLPRFR